MQAEFVGDFSSIHGVGEILTGSAAASLVRLCKYTHLLVGKDEQKGVSEFILAQHALHWVGLVRSSGSLDISLRTFLASLGDTLSVVRVDDKDDTLGVLEVCYCASTLMPVGRVDVERDTYNASTGDESCPDLRRPTR